MVKTYKWVLKIALEAMTNNKLDAIVINGDKVMRKAIKELFLGIMHRLYTWHLQRNAKTNMKHDVFLKDMKKCMYANISLE